MLTRFERYLPTLKIKQQQLQATLIDAHQRRSAAHDALAEAVGRFEPYKSVTRDLAGLNINSLAEPLEVRTVRRNIAGVSVPDFQDAIFPRASYSLFATPAWVDGAIADLREINRRRAAMEIIDEQCRLIQRELTRVTQRVNLFEKVMIPSAREAIRRIRIQLGDEMTAAVVRAKIAKGKIGEMKTAATTLAAAGREGAA